MRSKAVGKSVHVRFFSARAIRAWIGAALVVMPLQAAAHFAVSQQRMIFDDKSQSQLLVLTNTTERPLRFITSYENRAMQPDGRLVLIEAGSRGRSAEKWVRFSPRRGVISPGGKQVLQFYVRRGNVLTKGEYLSFLSITGQPHGPGQDNGFGPSRTLRIPVMLRYGDVEASPRLDGFRLVENEGQFSLEFDQFIEGDHSLLGDYTVIDDTGDMLAQLTGEAHYAPLKRRHFKLPLKQKPQGVLRIRYIEDPSNGGDEQIEKMLKLN